MIIGKFTVTPKHEEHLRTAALETLLSEHFSDQNLAKGTFDEKMFTCSVKGCSN